jgi:hypothetical protein
MTEIIKRKLDGEIKDAEGERDYVEKELKL